MARPIFQIERLSQSNPAASQGFTWIQLHGVRSHHETMAGACPEPQLFCSQSLLLWTVCLRSCPFERGRQRAGHPRHFGELAVLRGKAVSILSLSNRTERLLAASSVCCCAPLRSPLSQPLSLEQD